MKQLNFTETNDSPYKFMGAMLAPKGAYYIEYIDRNPEKWADFFPVMYIQLWQDPNGVVWNVPLWSNEIQEYFREEKFTYQEYIERVINENRQIETCLTCWDFILLCRRINHTSFDSISLVMENMYHSVINGEVGTTPELREYFRRGVWGDLRTMENDGSLDADWLVDELTPKGTIKPYPGEWNL